LAFPGLTKKGRNKKASEQDVIAANCLTLCLEVYCYICFLSAVDLAPIVSMLNFLFRYYNLWQGGRLSTSLGDLRARTRGTLANTQQNIRYSGSFNRTGGKLCLIKAKVSNNPGRITDDPGKPLNRTSGSVILGHHSAEHQLTLGTIKPKIR
jgi:hypothetical protein